MTEPPTPKTDALREVIIGQYKEDELTGNGMGNILAALTDIETLERERDEARKELDALKATIAKSGLIEVEATTCIADKCGKPTIVKNGTMLVHKDEKLRMQQRTVDLQKHAATARKLAAERALADRLHGALDALDYNLAFAGNTLIGGLRERVTAMRAIALPALAAWKESRQDRNHS